MGKVILDAATRAKFDGLNEVPGLYDEAGEVIGYYHPPPKGANPAGGWGGFAAEEVAAAFDPADKGRPLEDIMAELRKL